MARVFISYSRLNRDMAERIEVLIFDELNPWRDKLDIEVGREWRDEIDSALADSYALILLATNESASSVNVIYEWAKALGMQIPIIPIYYPHAGFIPAQLSHMNGISLDDLSLGETLNQKLSEYKEKDELTNIHIPVEASPALRRLASKAFNYGFSIEENAQALFRLSEMLSDEMVGHIFIQGLNHPQHSVKLEILKYMNEKDFLDARMIPKLEEFLFLQKDSRPYIENERRVLREWAMTFFIRLGDIALTHLTRIFPNTYDKKFRKAILSILSHSKSPRIIPFLTYCLHLPDEEEREWAEKFIITINPHDFKPEEEFLGYADRYLISELKDMLEELVPEYTHRNGSINKNKCDKILQLLFNIKLEKANNVARQFATHHKRG